MNLKKIGYVLLLTIHTFSVYATQYYCDPVNGNIENNGLSTVTAWPDLASVVSQKSFLQGDVIYLMSGNHGTPAITSKNDGEVTITKLPNEEPIIKCIIFSGASNWKIYRLKISSEGARVPFTPPLEHPVYPVKNNSLIQIVNASTFITINTCFIASVENSSKWTKEDWNYKAWNGIYSDQNCNVTIRDCYLKNINFGIHNTSSCVNNTYENNIIENFNGDGIRGHGTNTVIQYNTVMNSYATNGNHDDLIQAFQADQIGLVIRGNKLFAYTNSSQPFKSVCQGIGLFDGMYRNFIIENNIVATNHWHGITLLGAENCKIMNNTVVDLDSTDTPVPWIMIEGHKNGSPSTNCIIRNNICTALKKSNGVTSDHNQVISFSEYEDYFVDFRHLNFHLKKTSPAVDAGTPEHAPAFDIAQTIRPQRNGCDVGAYEYAEDSTKQKKKE